MFDTIKIVYFLVAKFDPEVQRKQFCSICGNGVVKKQLCKDLISLLNTYILRYR